MITQQGAGALIGWAGSGDSILVRNVLPADLTSDDFLFGPLSQPAPRGAILAGAFARAEFGHAASDMVHPMAMLTLGEGHFSAGQHLQIA